jgi:pimeloyl-ACP methyl ester carboxylesterase
MLGYGWSPKVEEEYCMELWGQQVIDFSQQIGGATEKDKTIIVGNSIGALAALYAASTSPQSCKGLCLVNSAGNFEPDAAAGPEKKTLAQRAVGDAKDIDDKSGREVIRRAASRGVWPLCRRRHLLLDQV